MISRAFQIFLFLAAAAAVFVQYRLSSCGVSPVSLSLPDLPILPPDDRLTGIVERIGENDLIGPESLAVAKHGGVTVMFAALGDGRLVRLTEEKDGSASWTTLLRTGELPADGRQCGAGGPTDVTNTEGICGRPLGLAVVRRHTVDPDFKGTKDEDVLIVADSYRGLLMISDVYGGEGNAKLRVLATRANSDEEEYAFALLNAVVQAPDGSLYFTQTSRYIQRRRIFYAVFDGRPTGRLLRYTKGQGVEVVVDSLYMPNGIALSHGGDELVIVSGVKILKYSIPRQEMEPDPFVSVMPGTGDNIKSFTHLPTGERRNCYWAGLGSKFAQPFSLLKATSDKPTLKACLIAVLPYKTIVNLIPKLSALAVYDEDGTLVETYQDTNTTAPWLSEAEPMGDHIYLASWYNPFLARAKKNNLVSGKQN